MAINQYFQDELNYLRALGREFSLQNPALSKFLSAEGDDPDVDRLFEGFAFLTGRIRQKLDDSLPEITHTLLNLLWPNYLRPVPAMSILQFSPIPQALSKGKTIEKGVEVHSHDVEQTTCIFQTCYDVDIYPLSLNDVQTQIRSDGALMDLSFLFDEGTIVSEQQINHIRLYLHCGLERTTAQTLHLWLFQYLERVELTIQQYGRDKPIRASLPIDKIKPVGFAPDQALLPDADVTFSGYRLLQEYFQLPEKFQFFDITGLQAHLSHPDITGFNVRFKFNRQFDKQLMLSKDDLRLFCTPVVNLFDATAKPIRVDHKRQDYLLTPEHQKPEHIAIFSVTAVSGKIKGHSQRVEYPAFESFVHESDKNRVNERQYYKLIQKSSVLHQGFDNYLTFVDGNDKNTDLVCETVSVDLKCTNAKLAETLRVGDICLASGSSPGFAHFSNITQVTEAINPPVESALHWRLVANLALHYKSLTTIEALKLLILHYDFAAFSNLQQQRANQQMASGIEDIEVQQVDSIVKGVAVRGLKTIVKMRESAFGSKGIQGEVNMYQFACVLNGYFKQFAPLNSFHQLEVKAMESGEIWCWEHRRWHIN